MRFAAIETSAEWCSVALWNEGEIAAIERRVGQRHAELVLPMLERLLARAGMRADGLDAVAFGAGPGSFTGLRIACAVAQGLAFARSLPVVGVPTLEAIAEESGAARVIACVDARMHEVYYAALEKVDGVWRDVVPATCVAPAEVSVPPGVRWIGCGGAFSVYGDALRSALGDSLERVRPEVHAAAAAIARLAASRLAAGGGADAAQAAPVYVRDKVALTLKEQRERA